MHKVEQQGYKSCASLMKLADRYGTERLENAYIKALSYKPSLKNISTILKNDQDKVAVAKAASNKESSKYGITRGVFYCGGGVTVYDSSVNHRPTARYVIICNVRCF